jgi:hypothetical protein
MLRAPVLAPFLALFSSINDVRGKDIINIDGIILFMYKFLNLLVNFCSFGILPLLLFPGTQAVLPKWSVHNFTTAVPLNLQNKHGSTFLKTEETWVS